METVEKNEIDFLSRKILDLNKQLIESEKAKSRFLSLIASELNNPMTAILGIIPLLEPTVGNKCHDKFELVLEEALLLESRIQNLVAASELESGIVDVTCAMVDPKSLIEELIEAFKFKLKRKNITIVVETRLTTKIITDPKKLYLILKNIISNACDYGDADACVNVLIEQNEKNNIFIIKNQGNGPAVEYKPQVFTRFVHCMEGAHGLGLGLSVARELCENMDGTIDYEVHEHGVIFTVTLPIQNLDSQSDANGSNEFLFESFDDVIEL